MPITFTPLPFDTDSLEPFISRETLQFHHGKHHRGYVDKTNELIRGTPFDSMTLEEIMFESYPKNRRIFNNAAQVWNHEFFWECMTPEGEDEPTPFLSYAIEENFSNFENFREEFSQKGKDLFGSGYVWLVKNVDNSLEIITGRNADNPLVVRRQVPLLTCDVWEHSYYLDYQNDRASFLENFWQIVNWEFVEFRFDSGRLHTEPHAKDSFPFSEGRV